MRPSREETELLRHATALLQALLLTVKRFEKVFDANLPSALTEVFHAYPAVHGRNVAPFYGACLGANISQLVVAGVLLVQNVPIHRR